LWVTKQSLLLPTTLHNCPVYVWVVVQLCNLARGGLGWGACFVAIVCLRSLIVVKHELLQNSQLLLVLLCHLEMNVLSLMISRYKVKRRSLDRLIINMVLIDQMFLNNVII